MPAVTSASASVRLNLSAKTQLCSAKPRCSVRTAPNGRPSARRGMVVRAEEVTSSSGASTLPFNLLPVLSHHQYPRKTGVEFPNHTST